MSQIIHRKILTHKFREYILMKLYKRRNPVGSMGFCILILLKIKSLLSCRKLEITAHAFNAFLSWLLQFSSCGSQQVSLVSPAACPKCSIKAHHSEESITLLFKPASTGYHTHNWCSNHFNSLQFISTDFSATIFSFRVLTFIGQSFLSFTCFQLNPKVIQHFKLLPLDIQTA